MPEAEKLMMEEEKAAEPSVDSTEGELEFRPWVKWCGIGLAGAASLGLFLGTYYIGYAQGQGDGYLQATSSGLVQQHLNEAASQNVLNFMRLASASDDYLQKAAANTAAAFAWIQEEEVRHEAEWSLALALLERGMVEAGLKVMDTLFAGVAHSSEWAFRAMKAGDIFVSLQQYPVAVRYYRCSADIFAANKQPRQSVQALGQLISLEICSAKNGTALLDTLNERLQELEKLGDDAAPLRSVVLSQMGVLHRMSGRGQEAETAFRAALNGVPLQQEMQPALAASCGLALQECGDSAAAEPLFRKVESNAGTRPADVMARLMALRQLAVIEYERGHRVTAQALLHRAQGVAEGRVQTDNVFWPCLYDQRGWMHFAVQNYQTALLDFTAALAATSDAMLLIQPMEGAARCYMEQGKNHEALQLLEQCMQLRQQHAPGDKVSQGRVHLLLGQMYDMLGRVAEAEVSYGLAVEYQPGDSPDEVENRTVALMGRAYILTDMKRWAEAYALWQQALPLLETQPDKREEARAQMRRIKPLIPAEQQAENTESVS